MKKKGRSAKIFTGWTLAFVLVIGIIGFASQDTSAQIYELRIGGGARTSDSGTSESSPTGNVGVPHSDVPIESIFCKIKQTTNVVNNNDVIIDKEQSPFLSGNPVFVFDVTDIKTETDITDGGFDVVLKIKCASGGTITNDVFEDRNPFNAIVQAPLEVNDGFLAVNVYSKDIDGKEINTFNANLEFDELEINNANEKSLGDLRISAKDLLKFVPEGEYDSFQRIALSGVIEVAFQTEPDFDYELVVEEESIPTFREVTINKISEEEPPEVKCSEGQVKRNNKCEPKEKPEEGEDNEDPEVKTLSTLDELFLCMGNFNTSCFLQTKFYPYYFGVLGTLFFIGAVTHNSAPKFDQFGNRIG